MNLLSQTEELCKKYKIQPVRSRGQNFLIDEKTYEKIIEASDIKKDDIVLEVGPGLGFLTEKLAAKAKEVIAVELDYKLQKALAARLAEQNIVNTKIINADILKVSQEDLGLEKKDFKIVANLPYNITSFFLRKFLSGEHRPTEFVLMLQKEVAERIAARPNKMSLLAISVQFYADAEIIAQVPKRFFYPAPQVDSAVIRIKINNKIKLADESKFFNLVRSGFSSKRKMLKNNLDKVFGSTGEAEKILVSLGFSPKVRAEELSVSDWLKIFGKVSANVL